VAKVLVQIDHFPIKKDGPVYLVIVVNGILIPPILTPDGYLTLTALIFNIDPDEAMALTLAIPGEVGSVVAQVIRESFPDAKVTDPNAQGPEGK
jgi:hypothetical protein